MDPEPQVINEASCPSLSHQSQLEYHLGNTPDGTIHIRLTGNSGNGNFNVYWVSLPAILSLLNEQEEPFIWELLCPLFEGRSVNSACFLMAALKNEGLVQQSKDQPRRYERGDPAKFTTKMKSLVAKPEYKKGGTAQKSAKEVDTEVPATATA